jgi:endonuclease YncB( thermonuclease family)
MKILLTLLLSISLYALDIDKIVSVYDGDTFKVDLKCNEPLLCKNLPIRVYGVDTPEIRNKDLIQKALGFKAKDFTVDFVKNGVILEECKRGKYFRLVCKVRNDKEYLSEYLIRNNVAVEYYGGTKVFDLENLK